MFGRHSETTVGRVSITAPHLPAAVSDPHRLEVCNQAILPLSETMGTRGLRALARTSRERALVSRVELTAFQQGADVFEFADAVADASTALWFRTRQFGLPLGIVEGLALRTGSGAEWALGVAKSSGSLITQLTALATEDMPTDSPPQTTTILAGRGWLLNRTRARFREVLRLEPGYEPTLATFGRHTRRNLRNARKLALAKGLSFSLSLNGTGIPSDARIALGRNTDPYPLLEPRMRPFEAYADAAGQPFRSAVRSGDRELISYCCGFLDKNVAYLVYQLNSRDWAESGPSLLHRAFLIEALADSGCKEIVFIHGCSGVLRHACLPMVLDQYVVVRDGAAAKAAAKLIYKLRPQSRIGKILHAAFTGATDVCLGEAVC